MSLEKQVTAFRDPGEAAIVPLSHLGILEVKGKGAETLLQGQTSAQVGLAKGGFAPLTCFCTAKGRMLANAQLWQVSAEHYRLMLSRDLLASLHRHLEKFAPFYQAELKVQDDLILMGIVGEALGREVAEHYGMELPGASWHQANSNDQRTQLVRHPGEEPRWVLCSGDKRALTPAGIATPLSDPASWQAMDIQSGLAWLTADQQDRFLPQMFNWEALGGISFKKGCYTGQEVVARAHFRGQVKKRLARARVMAESLPEIGAIVCNDEGKAVGEVVAAVAYPQGATDILAVLSTQASETIQASETPAALTVGNSAVELLPLPYAIERVDPESLVQGL
ncbi:folate-binding protein [Halomonas sp. Bachu 37]|uniref:CAF17-like 4Fe-4S cluster assembly/insertion protein YgfZ n=1 Tax=Halomonas kashgarensis TaxID=3084920 RepID=UPI003217D19D